MIPDSVLSGFEHSVQHAAIGKPVTLATPYSSSYPGQGPGTLVNGILGCVGVWPGEWLGYLGNDLDATIDLGQSTQLSQLTVDCLQTVAYGIYLPSQVVFWAGNTSSNLTVLQTVTNSISQDTLGPFRASFSTGTLNVQARYVRVVAHNIGVIPSGHPGAGVASWLFVDEITVNPQPASP